MYKSDPNLVVNKVIIPERLDLSKGKVDATDPCYERGTWCAAFGLDVVPGKYRCGYEVSNDDRIVTNFIIHEDYSTDFYNLHFELAYEIGVDAGLFGYFPDKHDFPQDEWEQLCQWMWAKDKESKDIASYYFRDDVGFWTSSGYGDGGYPVYAAKTSDGKIIGLLTEFIASE